jgi:short-subunit dehydrogenase
LRLPSAASAAGNAFKARGKGAIMNIASTIVFAPDIYDGLEGLYSATKTYLFHLSQSLTDHLKSAGVHVQAVLPGVVRTPIWEVAGRSVDAFPQEMVMEPGDLVDAALIGFDRGEAVTLPTVSNEALWRDIEQARTALLAEISSNQPAARYRLSGAARGD